jgi:hypothetical protein
LTERLERRFREQAGNPLEFSFVGFLHKRLVPVVLMEAKIESKGGGERLDSESVKRLATLLKGWKIAVTGTQSWMHSQVTAGGVELGEVEAGTLESRLARGSISRARCSTWMETVGGSTCNGPGRRTCGRNRGRAGFSHEFSSCRRSG